MLTYTLSQISENEYNLINSNGIVFKAFDGSPYLFKSKESAEKTMWEFNNPVYNRPQPLKKQKQSKVMDNRHRNWRKRNY